MADGWTIGTIGPRATALLPWLFLLSWARAVVGVAAIRLRPEVADLGSADAPEAAMSLDSSS